jgi:hypothetical protein
VKKPCMLTVWFHKIASGHGRPSHVCHHHCASSPCCLGCTCGTPTRKPVSGSPQASVAMAPGEPAAPDMPPLEPAPVGLTGAEPGDVAEEGKLFERVSFERFDKAP